MLEGMTALGFMAATLVAGPARADGRRHPLPRTPACGSRRRRRSTCCPAGAPGSGSARPGTRRSRARSGSRSRRSASASRCSRRRSRSPTRCGRASAARRRRSRAAITGRSGCSTRRSRSHGRASRSWSAAAASGRRSGWSPSTPTRATCSASPEASPTSTRSSMPLRGGRPRPRRDRALDAPGRAARSAELGPHGVAATGHRPLRRAVRRRRRARHRRAQGCPRARVRRDLRSGHHPGAPRVTVTSFVMLCTLLS